MKKLAISIFMVATVLCAFGQGGETAREQDADTVFRFKFHGTNDMFFGDYRDNAPQLKELIKSVRKNINALDRGARINVRGYSSALASTQENLRSARIRSNRVKSVLITRAGVTEDDFVTRNSDEKYDGENSAVVVFMIYPAPVNAVAVKPAPQEPAEDQKPVAQKPAEEQKPVAQKPAEDQKPVDQKPAEDQKPATSQSVSPSSSQPAPAEAAQGDGKDKKKLTDYFAIRANLLYWVAMSPDLGIEWKMTNRFGLLLHGEWAHWTWNDAQRRWHIWRLQPEVRYYLGQKERWYLGLSGHGGEICEMLPDVKYGRQGSFIGGGITGGYSLPIKQHWGFDFNLGLGYTKLKYDTFRRSGGVDIKQTHETRNFIGPTQAGVVLFYKF